MIDTDAGASSVSWSDDHDAYVARFDDDGVVPSVVVAETLEATLDEQIEPLFDYVDPDALDNLVSDPSVAVKVTFDVEEATVTVHSDGRVFVRV
ncbi:HalOD1 output domain-containing protein [Haloplanus aerogenes]|uniref:Halobacterial output domain-containing protein n=1 Tax=Haloplanus aerogenes TaxID=660522 RepID=A0A3M0DA31_9EURY|nr:HalOD1 output domain-containing protein [Haloplanus aerogenes]AZH26111.1 hypothetical protein DU502_12410 [Haloplanus aerogenes]RMB18438.1 hypothetical protein ATH50_1894 [Haloplanus aerogenes]